MRFRCAGCGRFVRTADVLEGRVNFITSHGGIIVKQGHVGCVETSVLPEPVEEVPRIRVSVNFGSIEHLFKQFCARVMWDNRPRDERCFQGVVGGYE